MGACSRRGLIRSWDLLEDLQHPSKGYTQNHAVRVPFEVILYSCFSVPMCTLKPWPNDYTFLLTFAIHLYCKSRAMYCVMAKRLDISLYNLFAFTEDFSPSQQQPVKQHKRAQIFMRKWSAIEENNYTEDLSERECFIS